MFSTSNEVMEIRAPDPAYRPAHPIHLTCDAGTGMPILMHYGHTGNPACAPSQSVRWNAQRPPERVKSFLMASFTFVTSVPAPAPS